MVLLSVCEPSSLSLKFQPSPPDFSLVRVYLSRVNQCLCFQSHHLYIYIYAHRFLKWVNTFLTDSHQVRGLRLQLPSLCFLMDFHICIYILEKILERHFPLQKPNTTNIKRLYNVKVLKQMLFTSRFIATRKRERTFEHMRWAEFGIVTWQQSENKNEIELSKSIIASVQANMHKNFSWCQTDPVVPEHYSEAIIMEF